MVQNCTTDWMGWKRTRVWNEILWNWCVETVREMSKINNVDEEQVWMVEIGNVRYSKTEKAVTTRRINVPDICASWADNENSINTFRPIGTTLQVSRDDSMVTSSDVTFFHFWYGPFGSIVRAKMFARLEETNVEFARENVSVSCTFRFDCFFFILFTISGVRNFPLPPVPRKFFNRYAVRVSRIIVSVAKKMRFPMFPRGIPFRQLLLPICRSWDASTFFRPDCSITPRWFCLNVTGKLETIDEIVVSWECLWKYWTGIYEKVENRWIKVFLSP